jgi:hypothetical protein
MNTMLQSPHCQNWFTPPGDDGHIYTMHAEVDTPVPQAPTPPPPEPIVRNER